MKVALTSKTARQWILKAVWTNKCRHSPSTTSRGAALETLNLCLTSKCKNCTVIQFCHLKPLSLWQFIAAPKGNSHSVKVFISSLINWKLETTSWHHWTLFVPASIGKSVASENDCSSISGATHFSRTLSYLYQEQRLSFPCHGQTFGTTTKAVW